MTDATMMVRWAACWDDIGFPKSLWFISAYLSAEYFWLGSQMLISYYPFLVSLVYLSRQDLHFPIQIQDCQCLAEHQEQGKRPSCWELWGCWDCWGCYQMRDGASWLLFFFPEYKELYLWPWFRVYLDKYYCQGYIIWIYHIEWERIGWDRIVMKQYYVIFYQFSINQSRMLTRAESLKKSGFIPKETFTPGSRPSSPASKFRYFGDDSQVSSLASLYYKKSQKLLGTRFTDSSFKLSTISRIDNQSNPLRQKGGYVEKVGERVKENKRTQAKAVGHPPMSEDKSEISEIQSMKSQSVSNLKEEMGELNGRLKNLEGLLSTLASSEIKTREEIRSLRKCVSEKSLGKEDFSKYKMPSYPNPMLYSNSNISETLTQNPGIRRDLKRKVKQCECHCTGTKEREKEQMSGIIFQLYEENKFYENQLSKMGELKKSSVLKNKARINQLLSKIRNV